jgi:hypothetical protein
MDAASPTGRRRLQISRNKHRAALLAAVKPKKPTRRPVTLHLTRSHSVNNVNYGPGTVVVKPDLAAVFMEQERNADRADMNFAERQPMKTLIAEDRRLMRFPPSADMNALLAYGPLVGTLYGGGV